QAAVDQLRERRERGREPPPGVGERDEDRVIRVKASLAGLLSTGLLSTGTLNAGSAGGGGQRAHLLADGLQPRGLLRRREPAVADVVDPPRVGVDGGEGTALVRWQQPDAVGEVPGLLPGDLLALGVGFVGVHGHLPLMKQLAIMTSVSALPGLGVARRTS